MIAPWKNSYGKPRACIKKQRHRLADKGTYIQSYGFSSNQYGCENWTIKKAECQGIELWYWRRLLRFPWTARKSSQSILKEISPEISLEGMILKLKIQYFGHLMRRTDSLGKTLILGMIEEEGMTEDEMVGWHHRLDGHGYGWTPGVGDGQGGLVCCNSWCLKESDTTERLN